MELIKITEKGVSGRELHKFLEIKHKFRDWIRNSIKDYKFKEGEDFSYFFSESTGGRPSKEYALSLNMAKELAMIAKTEKGRKARKYFLKCEKIARKSEAVRLAGIETRKGMTDRIKESNENERMHGHAYSRYTLLAYSLCNIEYNKEKNFRDTLSKEQIENVEVVESMISNLLKMKYQYQQIKNTLSPIITKPLSEN